MRSPRHTSSSSTDVFDHAAELLGDIADRDVALAPMTTYRVGGPAALFVTASSLDDLRRVARARAETGLPVVLIGRGSNMLVADSGFPGIAVSVTVGANAIDIGEPDGSTVPVVAGGGVALPVLARRTAASALTGFEWAVGVPGSVGGAVKMNAGGHGSDMAACLSTVEILDLSDADPQVEIRDVGDLGLAFRSSTLTDDEIVLSARMLLEQGDRQTSEQQISEIVRWRREHQPGGQNCGSVFVNPVPGEITAGGLIDGLGLRGYRIGSAAVSEKHANFIQADESATASDVLAVIESVRSQVAEASGFVMRSEVRLVGFDDVAGSGETDRG